ncbi:MAG: universal stress protein [Solirubrobacterales bacterium]
MSYPTVGDQTEAAPGGGAPQAVFPDIVCGIDGSRGGKLAARQAMALSGPDGVIRFVAIHHTVGVGLNEQSTLSQRRAAEALEEAERLARSQGLRVSAALISATHVSEVLRSEAKGHGLLVIGSHGGSRAGGIVLGGTVTQIAHRCEQPLLITRRAIDHGDFPDSVLLASDGSPGSWAAARAVARLAARRPVEVRVVHVHDGPDPEADREVGRQLSLIAGATGTPPRLQDKAGAVPERICQAARAGQSALIVIGRRGMSGIRALGSVSERVAHRAPCSVLLVPPEEDLE